MARTGSEYQLPLPPKEGLAAEFYRFCNRHELRFQRCTGCRTWRHVPRGMCAKCGSLKWEWARSSGRGKLFSWTTVRQPIVPSFAAEVPYSPVIVEMDEGVRLVSWLVDVKPEEMRLGLRLEVVFDDVTSETTLPKFKKAT